MGFLTVCALLLIIQESFNFVENSEINKDEFKKHVKIETYKLIDELNKQRATERFFLNLNLFGDYSTIFLLRTRQSETEIGNGNYDSLKTSNFDNTKPVKIIVHGWTFFPNSLKIQDELKNAFLEHEDANIIFADWTKRSDALYGFAVKNTLYAGLDIAKFIDWLVENGTPLKSFHLIGFSLGAHVVGIAGRSIKSGQIPYITALDPASFKWKNNINKLVASDAKYVEVIHTDTGFLGLGYKEPLGHADFYPNKGRDQPGCNFRTACSHSRSFELFSKSINNMKFTAYQCNDYQELLYGVCANFSQVQMGGSEPKDIKGIFYLETTDQQPYYIENSEDSNINKYRMRTKKTDFDF